MYSDIVDVRGKGMTSMKRVGEPLDGFTWVVMGLVVEFARPQHRSLESL